MFMKPLTQLEAIRSRLVEAGNEFNLPAGSELNMFNENNEQLIWFFSEGAVVLYREVDDLLMEVISSPTCIGLSNILQPSQVKYRLTTQTNCNGFNIPSNVALEIIEKNKLWQPVYHWTAFLLHSLENRDARFIGATKYSQIRATLLIMDSWSPELRERTGVITFVQKRTKISRSVIAEILSALRKGNYIEMDKGKLKSVNRLPTSY